MQTFCMNPPILLSHSCFISRPRANRVTLGTTAQRMSLECTTDTDVAVCKKISGGRKNPGSGVRARLGAGRAGSGGPGEAAGGRREELHESRPWSSWPRCYSISKNLPKILTKKRIWARNKKKSSTFVCNCSGGRLVNGVRKNSACHM